MEDTILCSNCNAVLDITLANEPVDKRTPCSKCGSSVRTHGCSIVESITVRDSIRHKVKSPNQKGRGGMIVQGFCGYSFYGKTQKWHWREWTADRENDLYEELIIDTETGLVIMDVMERLSDHRGHGSAKHRRQDSRLRGNDD
jgi:hypothetical protein